MLFLHDNMSTSCRVIFTKSACFLLLRAPIFVFSVHALMPTVKLAGPFRGPFYGFVLHLHNDGLVFPLLAKCYTTPTTASEFKCCTNMKLQTFYLLKSLTETRVGPTCLVVFYDQRGNTPHIKSFNS